jgi:hypothetical protein
MPSISVGCLFLIFCVLPTGCRGQDIKPLSSSSAQTNFDAVNHGGSAAPGLLDLSGFSVTQRTASLTLQLLDELPIWTVHSLSNPQSQRESDADQDTNYWTGLSDDGVVSARFLHYTHPSTGITITRGVVHDLSTDTTFQIKQNYRGQDTVTEIRQRDMPPLGEEVLPPSSALQLPVVLRNPSSLASQLWSQVAKAWNSRDAQPPQPTTEQTNVTIDIMVIWTPHAECRLSDADIDCTLTDTTKANMEADIALWVADTNTAHANSETGVTIRVVHQQLDTSGYREDSIQPTLTLLDLADTEHPELGYIHDLRWGTVYILSLFSTSTNFKTHSSLFPFPFGSIGFIRDEYKADLVTMVADMTRLSCNPVRGIAFVAPDDATYGFSVLDAFYVSSDYVAAHGEEQPKFILQYQFVSVNIHPANPNKFASSFVYTPCRIRPQPWLRS